MRTTKGNNGSRNAKGNAMIKEGQKFTARGIQWRAVSDEDVSIVDRKGSRIWAVRVDEPDTDAMIAAEEIESEVQA
jgi:hypothetical protein